MAAPEQAPQQPPGTSHGGSPTGAASAAGAQADAGTANEIPGAKGPASNAQVLGVHTGTLSNLTAPVSAGADGSPASGVVVLGAAALAELAGQSEYQQLSGPALQIVADLQRSKAD